MIAEPNIYDIYVLWLEGCQHWKDSIFVNENVKWGNKYNITANIYIGAAFYKICTIYILLTLEPPKQHFVEREKVFHRCKLGEVK